MISNALKDFKVVKVSNGAAAGTTLVTSSTIDASGFNAALVIVDLGTVVATAVMQANLQDGNAANGSDAATIGSSTSVTDAGGASSNDQIVVDVQGFLKRYLTVTFSRTTANVTVNSITVILYNANGPKPVTQPTTVLGANTVVATA